MNWNAEKLSDNKRKLFLLSSITTNEANIEPTQCENKSYYKLNMPQKVYTTEEEDFWCKALQREILLGKTGHGKWIRLLLFNLF